MNRKKIKWIIVVWLSGMALVHADDFFAVKERIIREAWIKKFSLYISPTLSITNLGYNSNIYSYRDIEEPDWTADVGINLRAAAILKDRFIFVIDEFPYYSFYAKNKNEQAFNNKFQFTVYTHVGRFNLDYKLNLNSIRGRSNSEFGAKTRHKERNQMVSLDFGQHDRFYINLYAAQNRREYTDERYLEDYDLSRLDQEDVLLGISLNKRIFSRTRLSLIYEYYHTRFLHDPGKDGIGGKLSLGVDLPEISRVQGSLRYGWKSFFPKNPDYISFSKPFGAGELSIRLFRHFKFHFNYLVDNFFSFRSPEQYFDERTFEAGVEYYLSSRIKVGYWYQTGNLSYKNLVDGIETRKDDIYSARFSIGFRIFRKMGIALTYTVYRADSNQLDFTRRYNFIGGSIIHEF
jgi:hypothetical protein